MWVVADLDDDYIAKMEDVLEVYERPHDPQQPVICLDRSSPEIDSRFALKLSSSIVLLKFPPGICTHVNT